ncbi:MAG: NADH-quinone oxidoreductase subunit N, partial [Sediminibacterium sp.]
LITFAALNMVISFFYYLKVVKAIFMEENELPIQKINVPGITQLAMYVCVAGIIISGLASIIYDYIYSLSIGI